MVTGGELVEPYRSPNSTTSLRGRAIEGGVSRQVGPGDVVVIPGHTPALVERARRRHLLSDLPARPGQPIAPQVVPALMPLTWSRAMHHTTDVFSMRMARPRLTTMRWLPALVALFAALPSAASAQAVDDPATAYRGVAGSLLRHLSQRAPAYRRFHPGRRRRRTWGTSRPIPELWEKVIRKLRAGAMPPAPRPRPDQATYDGFRAWLETEIDTAAAMAPDPGRTETFHRLSRAEYRNVIRDLLDLDVDVSELLPADDTSYGFDNIAGVLGVSPTLMERYLSAARKIARLAVASPVPSPVAETYRLPSDLGQDDHIDGTALRDSRRALGQLHVPRGRRVRHRGPPRRRAPSRDAPARGHDRR